MNFLLFVIILFNLSITYANPLIIGTTTQNPPFSSLADQKDHFYGFDIDLMGEICRRIKQPCQFKPAIFNDLFTDLAAKKIDLAIAAIIITTDREQNFLFSLPYLESNALFMTKRQSAINQPIDITHQRVGVRRGTAFKELALSLYRNQITLEEFSEIDSLLEGLNSNQIDVVLMTAEAARYWFANNNTIYKLIGSQIPVGDGYGIMANKDQNKLITDINHALLDMEADGTYLKIFNQYTFHG